MNRIVYTFRSSSSPDKTYQTIKQRLKLAGNPYVLTCNCPGWTRRVNPNGFRSCVHTQLIDAGNPEGSISFVSKIEMPEVPEYPTQGYEEYERPAIKVKLGPVPIVKPPSPSPKPTPTRKFSFDD